MKITKIKIDRLAVDLVHPYHLSKEYGTFSTATPVLVTLYTDEGINMLLLIIFEGDVIVILFGCFDLEMEVLLLLLLLFILRKGFFLLLSRNELFFMLLLSLL